MKFIHFRGAVFVHVGSHCTENLVSFYMCTAVDVIWLAKTIRHTVRVHVCDCIQARNQGGTGGEKPP